MSGLCLWCRDGQGGSDGACRAPERCRAPVTWYLLPMTITEFFLPFCQTCCYNAAWRKVYEINHHQRYMVWSWNPRWQSERENILWDHMVLVNVASSTSSCLISSKSINMWSYLTSCTYNKKGNLSRSLDFSSLLFSLPLDILTYYMWHPMV